MKILIVSERYSSNLGDQAIFIGLSQYLNKKKHVIDSIDLSGRISSKNTGKRIGTVNLPVFLIRLLNIFRSLFMILRNFNIFTKKIKNSDIIIFGGGSLLIDNNNSFPSKLFLHSILNRWYKKEYIVLGCSARPVNSKPTRLMLKFFIKGALKVGLRDVKSIDLIEKTTKVECHFTPDTALFLSRSITKSPPRRRLRKIGINVMSPQKHGLFSDPIKFSRYISMIENLIIKLEDYDVYIFTTGDTSDNSFVLKHFQSLNNIFIPDSLESLLLFLSNKDKIFSTRLHASILALSQEVIPYTFSWDEKVIGFIETLDLKHFCTDLQNSDVNISELLAYIENHQVENEKKLISSVKDSINMKYNAFLNDVC